VRLHPVQLEATYRCPLVSGNHFSFTAIEPDRSVQHVPFHRVREVYRGGVTIWQGP